MSEPFCRILQRVREVVGAVPSARINWEKREKAAHNAFVRERGLISLKTQGERHLSAERVLTTILFYHALLLMRVAAGQPTEEIEDIYGNTYHRICLMLSEEDGNKPFKERRTIGDLVCRGPKSDFMNLYELPPGFQPQDEEKVLAIVQELTQHMLADIPVPDEFTYLEFL